MAYAPPMQQPASAMQQPAPMPQPAPAPMPAGPDFSSLERHLLKITSQIEALQRPDNVEQSIVAFRGELAEIRRAITEAMPRQAIDSIENEIRSLSRRIDETRQSGTDPQVLANLERALGEIYDALRALKPAEQLTGYDDAINNLGTKLDLILRSNDDPSTVRRLEDAISAMREITANVASNDALARVSGDLHALSAKVDQLSRAGDNSDSLASIEQRIAVAKQQGIGVIAAAGNLAGPVQFPACSPHVMAVGAIGQIGNYPEDSPQAFQAAAGAPVDGGLFIPSFSCRGPELDLCAPGVGVIACQSPDGYAACDGTSLAAAHVTALAALILAHHNDFKGSFASRDFRRVERLFQILKDTAQPIGHPWHTGSGLPDAAGALGLPSQPWPLAAPLDVGLGEMRHAVRHLDLLRFGLAETISFEPPRGPANVTYLPLNPTPLAFQAESGTKARVHELKAAMMMAGLSDSR